MRLRFPYRLKGGTIHGHCILEFITTDCACDIMSRKEIFADSEESVGEVFKRMARTGAKEIGALDTTGSIVGDITVIDLLRCCCPEEKRTELALCALAATRATRHSP